MAIVISSCNSLVGRNNWSRQQFKKYRLAHGYKQEGHQNAFIRDGKVYAFSTPASYKAECRQFAEHYAGLVCLMPNGEYKEYSRDQLVLSAVTRKGPGGIRYFQADEKGVEVELKTTKAKGDSPKVKSSELYKLWINSEAREQGYTYQAWLETTVECMSAFIKSKKTVNWILEKQ